MGETLRRTRSCLPEQQNVGGSAVVILKSARRFVPTGDLTPMAQFEMLQVALKAQDCRQLLPKCLARGALSPAQAAKAEVELNAPAADELVIAKAIPPGPPLTEIVKRGWFGSLQPTTFQR
jgi:hypothetical protein